MKMDITIAVPGLPFNGETFDKQSLGGSESAGYYMARALAALGHRVTVFCNTEPTRCVDVDYLPIGMFQKYIEFTQTDVCIVQRTPELFSNQMRTRFSALWCHDLALKRQEPLVRGLSWNYDKLFVLSEFMKKQYQEVYGLPEDFLIQTRNGIDLELIKQLRADRAKDPRAVRNPLALMYTARPERGLDVLLGEIMPRILEQEPNAKLYLASYHNPVAELADFYGQCKAMGDRLGDRVQYLGHLTKQKLYEVMQSAGLMVYPVPSRITPDFDEVSCISAMEAQANGLPMITSARGALPETLAPGAGVLIPDDVHSTAYYEAFAQATVRLMRDPAAWEAASQAGLDRAEQLDWKGVAEQWSEVFEREIRKNSADKATLASHFYRRSDIYAAKACLATLPVDDEKSRWVREQVESQWAFLNEEDGFRKQYERIGSTHNPDVINWSPREPRYHALRQWLAQTFPVKDGQQPAILDYGCAHGGYATNLLKDLPNLRFTGVDIDMHGIELAYSFAEKLGVSDRWRGVVGDLDRLSDPNVPEMTEEYDAVLAQEVLEHVKDPRATLMALEQRVKDGGIVYITVPFGPWEYTDYLRRWGGQQGVHQESPKGTTGYPYRAHLWEFDSHDIRDLLGDKGPESELTIQSMSFGHEPNTREPLGWWVVHYKVTPETRGKVGHIDMERKLWLQRPRQTVSANIMAGGANVDETLHWCLRSLEAVVDEVVIMDCGLSEEAHRILSTYDSRIRVFPGVDPKVHGFETPRNMGLEHCTQDWVVWIDCDEKLMAADHMTKYLRPNIFQGYSIRQHHFACDTHFDADMPVRFFRNNGKLRFFGMIHEHPEAGLNDGPGLTIVISDVHIPHVGYLLESGRQRKFDRNLPMLEADMVKYPTRRLQKHFIMREKMLIVNYELRRNGGRMTAELRQACRDVIEVWREHFRGKGHFSNVDPLTYYNQAVSLLGEGFSMAFQLAADKVQAQPNGATVTRFANQEDAEIEITHRAKQAAQPYQTRYW
jgi:glycosyltransferase involved in cell wall biosynthesis/2-polyprenyl-3-methyl-5-hydroxy-6-metoxy-1,4-benzoquinol methylase